MSVSFSEAISFFIGITFGVLLFTGIYTLLVLRGIRSEKKGLKTATQDIDAQYLEEMVKTAQSTFKESYHKRDFAKELTHVTMDMVDEIARYYYPASNHPLLELSIDEMLLLTDYIQRRLDGILNQRVLKNARHIRLSTFAGAYELKQKLDKTTLMKAAQSPQLRAATKVTLGVINAFNPVYWFRRLVVNTSLDFVTLKIARTIIAIAAEETAKVYSKKLFDHSLELNLVERELMSLDKEMQADDIPYNTPRH